MNYIELINQFWQCNNELPIGCNATAVYFYLLKTCNSLGWKRNFKHSDRYIAIQLGISVNTVKTAKNKLKQLGLIDFKTPEKTSRGLNGSTTYTILTLSEFDSVPICDVDSVPAPVPICDVDSVPDTINKLNKTKLNNKELEKENPPTPAIPLDENYYQLQKEKLLSSQKGFERWCMKKKCTRNEMLLYVDDFISQQEVIEKRWNKNEIIVHFENWINKIPHSSQAIQQNQTNQLNTNTFNEPSRPKITL
ncbi:hypothetical protein ETU10_08425 [Apibacter muscae]|uniref:Helix-turn-helix domain-containing protein n=1 Tax=Apibacter muscae TaxID=2509004 RepID=A0A563DEU5_9FLAO|nr:hypothetical protein [Apibacter muscae]TWP23111.1 hypothetical protein ETU10_08425 [Apibacter muscae]TWP28453.1 hypothetical protein ETU09_05885 [Apibacter muscae]